MIYTTNYNNWLCRFKRVASAYFSGLISEEDLPAYQLFLLEHSQFNANFTYDELERLKYPLSPFAAVDRHTYLRAVDNWAMHILRSKYQTDHHSKKLYPVFVGSHLFFNELHRYAQILNEKKAINLSKAETQSLCSPLFIELEKKVTTQEIIVKKNEIAENLESKNSNLKPMFFFQDEYQKICTIVFVGVKNSLSNEVSSLIGNLGYRADPIVAIRKILALYPRLFVDWTDTKSFWKELKELSLPKKHKTILNIMIDNLAEEMEKIIQNGTGHVFHNYYKPSIEANYKKLSRLFLENNEQSPLDLYIKYINDVISEINELSQSNFAIRSVILPELNTLLLNFQSALNLSNVPIIIRITQTLAEIKLLVNELSKKESQLMAFNEGDDLFGCKIQAILTTAYAMRAFARVLQIIDADLYASPEARAMISVTNQSYFEWLSNLDRLHSTRYHIVKIRSLIDVDSTTDIIFVELHPNNVVESVQFPHDVKRLLIDMLKSWSPKGRTIVIDATLNALNDPEIQSVLATAKPLINNGWLNLIIIQSLTKFSQLGLDKRSLGRLYVINNNQSYWHSINKKVNQLKEVEVVDKSTLDYFSDFQKNNQYNLKYLEKINSNTRYVYQKVVEQLNELELLERKRFRITMSSDPKSCYIALNLRGLLPSIDSTFKYTVKDIQGLATDILQYLIHPICDFIELALTERMSIGFPLSSINVVNDAMRLTIGLENKSQLDLYAEMITYVAFVINKLHNASKLFEKHPQKTYPTRINYFREKIKQFRAMTPGKQCSFSLMFKTNDANYYPPENRLPRKLNRIVKFENGNMKILLEHPVHDRQVQTTILREHDMSRIIAPLRKHNCDVPLSEIDTKTRRIIASCFTQETGFQNLVNTIFHLPSHTVTLRNFESLSSWNDENTYGPYTISNQPGLLVYIRLYQKKIQIIGTNVQVLYNEDKIDIKSGNDITKITDMLLSEREFSFLEGAYQGQIHYAKLLGGFDRPNKLKPHDNTKKIFTVNGDRCQIQIDYLCCQVEGITVLKRYIDQNTTCITIDCWGEKDPIHARFLRLMIAVYVKEIHQYDFSASDECFNHFLFNLDYEIVNQLFAEAINKIKHHQKTLLQLLPWLAQTSKQYFFNKIIFHNKLSWPSRRSEVSYVDCEGLISTAMNILRQSINNDGNKRMQ